MDAIILAMKLHVEHFNGLNAITAYGNGFVEVNQQRHSNSIFLMPRGPVRAWPVARFADLSASALADLTGETMEMLLLGTGPRQHFLPPAWLQPFLQRSVGVEVMASPAACRTYNILMAENRSIALALMIEPTEKEKA